MRLRFQQRALRQIDEALGYVAARSPSGADKIERRITTILDLLQLQSDIGRRTKIPGVRCVFLTPYPYLIDYFIGGGRNRRVAFRHTARRPI